MASKLYHTLSGFLQVNRTILNGPNMARLKIRILDSDSRIAVVTIFCSRTQHILNSSGAFRIEICVFPGGYDINKISRQAIQPAVGLVTREIRNTPCCILYLCLGGVIRKVV